MRIRRTHGEGLSAERNEKMGKRTNLELCLKGAGRRQKNLTKKKGHEKDKNQVFGYGSAGES